MFPRLLRPPSLPASRRAYSFFSSKSGGGRYFNSAKPPKAVAPAAPAKPDAKPAPDDASPPASSSSAAPPQPPAAPALIHAQNPADPPASASASPPSPFHPSPPPSSPQQPFHPQLSPHDLKLHQFFSLHRPLFLNTPPSALFDPAPAASLTGTPRDPDPDARAELAALDDPPEASLDADADAARQLARALVINTVGAAISWSDTLRRLGVRTAQLSLDPPAGPDVLADSTKRKRRKKMKKHKLKKRRKLQRAQRLKLKTGG